MKRILSFIILLLCGLILQGQATHEPMEGQVSYITSQNVYVKFASTEGISPGDTIFIRKDNKVIPALVVKELSSISAVCIPVPSVTLKLSDKVYYERKQKPLPVQEPQTVAETVENKETAVAEQAIPSKDTALIAKEAPKTNAQLINGYVAIASYLNFSDSPADNTQRMKYTISFNAKNIGNSKLSAESYITFVHQNDNWSEIQSNVFNGLKIYNLSLNYEFSKNYKLWLGRKINPKLSNMGAVDGAQFEMRYKPITVGIIAGFRPDYENYGFNFDLFQYGAYLYNEYAGKHGSMQSTLAFVQQTNSGKTDRRFAYLQHVNSLVKNLVFFGSLELSLYQKVLNTSDSTYADDNSPTLSNLYLSLSYRIIKQLSVSFSYSARNNIIYYESYKNYLDQLLEKQMLQGYLLNVNVRPVNKLTIGLTGGYRFMKADPRPTKNFYGYITYSQIPALNIAITGTYTYLQTGYIDGNIASLGITKDFFRGKLYTGLTYRYVDYQYAYNEATTTQNLAELSITWRIIRKLMFSVYYEGTFEGQYQFNRAYLQLNFGF